MEHNGKIVFQLLSLWIKIISLSLTLQLFWVCMSYVRPRTLQLLTVLLAGCTVMPQSAAYAAADVLAKGLVPHKALYDIDLVATHSGSQILNISGQMAYEWRPDCDGWLTDHKFKLHYVYADSPGMRISSDFSTYESFDGESFHYTSSRSRDGDIYQTILGDARMGVKGGKATFRSPEGIKYDLTPGTLFPIGHTLQLIDHAEKGDKFYTANVFDGSDEEGPIEISSFIGKAAKPKKSLLENPKIDAGMLSSKAWSVRMAVFPVKNEEEESDYEMSMNFHENGVISDMLIEYDDFSVSQHLVALEKIPAESCGSPAPVPKKP